jgi:hypothetical protein
MEIMNSEVKELKEKLINSELSVDNLTGNQVKILIKELENDLKTKQEELDELNKKIKDIKIKIDNFNKN